MLRSVQICSYSERFNNLTKTCDLCPESQYPRRPNDDKCFSCDSISSKIGEFTNEELQRFTFLCRLRGT